MSQYKRACSRVFGVSLPNSQRAVDLLTFGALSLRVGSAGLLGNFLLPCICAFNCSVYRRGGFRLWGVLFFAHFAHPFLLRINQLRIQ